MKKRMVFLAVVLAVVMVFSGCAGPKASAKLDPVQASQLENIPGPDNAVEESVPHHIIAPILQILEIITFF